jgi:hypothetical protein
MKIKSILSALMVLFFCSLNAQKKSLDVRNLNLEEFPNVSGSLWTRNPEKINTNQIKFFEDGTVVSANFSNAEHSDSLAENKAVLFLVLRTNNNKELDWYQNVLKNALDKGILKRGDRYAIASFSVKDGDHFIYPQKLSFTDDRNVLTRKVDSLDFHPKNRSYSGKNQVYLAVNEALKLMEESGLNMPKGIFILSDDRNMTPNFQGEDPVERSRMLDIPIYGIIYNNQQFTYETPDLCKQTFGFHFTEAGNDLNSAVSALIGYINGFNDRYAGLYYSFNYNSTFEKDGASHTVKVDSQKDQTAFIINAPSKTIGEWIEDNLILFIVGLVCFLGLIVFVIVYVKKNNRKKRELEAQQQEHLNELERIQAESDRKLKAQESEIQGIRDKASRDQADQEQQKRKAEQEAEDQVQFQKMLERGNLPWFEYKVGQDSGSYQIASPRLTVGRDNSSDWVVPHPTVSRKHFELTFKDHVYSIKDLNSSNGLMVNGQSVTSCELRHGDVIQAGELLLTFHI